MRTAKQIVALTSCVVDVDLLRHAHSVGLYTQRQKKREYVTIGLCHDTMNSPELCHRSMTQMGVMSQ